MTSKKQILRALQFETFRNSNPLNGSDDPARTITYEFEGSTRPSDWAFSTGYTGWSPYSEAEKSAVRAQLAYLEDLLNVDFVEVSGAGDPDINFVKADLTPGIIGEGGWRITYAGWSDNIGNWDGFIAFDTGTDVTSIESSIILHEVAHAMGLRHPFESSILSGEELTTKYAIMNYAANPDTGLLGDQLALYDLFALQNIWGSASNATGDSTYVGGDWLIWDTGGTDTIDGSGAGGPVSITLRPGRFSSVAGTDDVVIAYGVRIERAIGGAMDDLLRGNWLSNELIGAGGADRLVGLSGADTLDGGAGNDTLIGNRGRDTLLGGADDDVLRGGIGPDTLGGNEGNDILSGGRGRDMFLFELGDGIDTITDYNRRYDKITLTGFGDLAAVRPLMSKSGGDVVIDFGDGDQLVIRDAGMRAVVNDLIFEV